MESTSPAQVTWLSHRTVCEVNGYIELRGGQKIRSKEDVWPLAAGTVPGPGRDRPRIARPWRASQTATAVGGGGRRSAVARRICVKMTCSVRCGRSMRRRSAPDPNINGAHPGQRVSCSR